jgi:hypothetical protein
MVGKKCSIFFCGLFISLLLSNPLFPASQPVSSSNKNKPGVPDGLEGIWDAKKYISLDEIKPGMNAYCLTEYGTAGVEMFGMEVVDVVRDIDIDGSRDVFLVKGTDERFIRTGPVAGCSGSPVYINGRMAGALAYTWSLSKEPLYAATPIADMLKIDLADRRQRSLMVEGGNRQALPEQSSVKIDFSDPIDLQEISTKYKNALTKPIRSQSGLIPLPFPVVTGGISSDISSQIKSIAEPLGLMVVSGGTQGGDKDIQTEAQLVPGSSLSVPIVSGDIKLSVVGTVTEVAGDKVYGFGHPLIGYGQIDLPMATAKVHTVVSNLSSSFKLATAGKIVGALSMDESSGIVGHLGKQARAIPLVIRVDNYNDEQVRQYNCKLAVNKLLSAQYLEMALTSAAIKAGALSPEHTIEYNAKINLRKYGSINVENISTDKGLDEALADCSGAIDLLLDNPFEQADIESFQFDIKIVPKSSSSAIWALDLSDVVVKAGEEVNISTIIETYLDGKTRYECRLKVPDDVAAGKYDVIVCGAKEYEKFLVKNVPYRFVAQNITSLVEALNNTLAVHRDGLHFILMLPSGGIALERAELPNLPATKAMVLQSNKRPLDIQPYQSWVEKSIKTGTVVAGKKTIQITVEQKN